MVLESITLCPICGNTSFENYLNCIDYTTTKETFQLVQCAGCKFVITSPRPTQSEIGKYYESDKYISHTGGSEKLIDRIYLIARSYSLRQKRKLVETFTSRGSLLDYGAGTGNFLAQCKENGWNCQGIEPSKTARAAAQKNSQMPVYQSINELLGNKFNAITLWHVLEHIHQLTDTLKELTTLLHPDGVLFIAVPNRESYDASVYKNHWAAYDVPRHLWHFSKENIANLLSQNGLTLVDVKPMKLDSFYVSLLSEGYKKPTKSRLAQILTAIYIGMKSNLKAKKKTNYSSLIYIARK